MSGNSLQATRASVADFSTFMVAGALEKPCLGQPFQLGMLYDCRSDALIPGVTLWGLEALNTALSKKPFETSDFEIIAEDSLSEKLLRLGVDPSLKLSILSGLVQVEGAAKFLYDQKSSRKQARVSLKYKSTTRFEQLTMDTLRNFEYTDVFEKDIATHVVTGMVYGADAFFVFDQEIGENEDMRKILGNLKVKVGGLPGLQKLAIGGESSVDVNTGDKEDDERLHCKFYGDLNLPKHPATFHDAAKLCQELPELLQGKSIPKTVCLYPLGKLDSKAQRMVHQISPRLVDELYMLMEYLHDIIMRGNDLIKTEVCSNFLSLKDDLESMKGLISSYRTDLKKNLAKMLPKVRGGETDETKVAEILEKNNLSPFSHPTLSGWISGKENEIKIFAGYLKHLKEQEVIQLVFEPGEVDVIVNDLDIEVVVCFDFGITWGQDALLLKMKDYLRNGEIYQGGSTQQPWYKNQALMPEMRQQFRCFKSFAIANHRRKATKFIVTNSDSRNDTETAFVSLYENGCESTFEVPYKPGKPKASNISHTGLQVNWEIPKYGASVQSYTVSYTDDESSGQWCTQTTSGAEQQLVLSELVPGTAYSLKVRAETNAGCGPDSDVYMIRLPPSAPDKPHASNITHNSLQLNWNKPSHGSETVQSYTIFYHMTDSDDWNSYKLANQQEHVHLSNFVPKTAYVFKVRAESIAGASQDSELSDPIETLSPISEPGKLTTTRVTHNSVTLKWNKPKRGADIVEYYTIFYQRYVDNAADNSWHTHKTSKPLETVELTDLIPQTAYVFKVRAESTVGASQDSEISDPIETFLPISQPGKPTATRVTHNSVTLKWDKPERGADIVEHYTIFYQCSVDDPTDSNWHTHKTSKPLETALLSDLVPQTAYVFKVRAESTAGASQASMISDSIETLLPISQPGKPRYSKVTHNSITLKWDKPEQGADIVEHYTIFYRCFVDDPADSSWHTHKTSKPLETALLFDLVPQTAYVFKVRAESTAEASPDSEISDPIETFLPISQPGKPTATRVTHNSITLKWDKPEQGANIVEHYTIFYRRSVDDPVDNSWHAHKTAKLLESISNLVPQTAYVFKVRAESTAGASQDSEISDPIETLLPISQPGKPRESKVTHDSITLKWDKPERGAGIIKQYTIFCRRSVDDPDAHSSWHTYCKSDKPPEIAKISNLVPKTAYVFKVRAESTAGASQDSELSDPIETLLPISEPGRPTTTRVTHNSIALKWDKPKRGANIVEHYTIFYRRSVDDVGAWKIHETPNRKPEATVLNLDSKMSYIFKVRPEFASASCTSPESESSDPIETLSAIGQPGKPHASNVTDSSITLQWSKPDRGASIVQYYTIFYRRFADDTGNWNAIKTSNAQQKATLINLHPKTSYIFMLRAECAISFSPDSKISGPIETLLPISQPGKPIATDVAHNCIALRWRKPEHCSHNVQHYTIFYRDTRSCIDHHIKINASSSRAQEEVKIANLAPNTEYTFRVKAESNTGVSPESELSNPIRTLMLLSQPGKPFATKVTHDSVMLKWERPKQGAQYLNPYKVIYYSTDDPDNIASRTAKLEKITLKKLDPESAYIFKVKAETVAGSISESEISDPIKTQLSPPGKPYATNITYKSFLVNWQRPNYGPILRYNLLYRATNDPSDMWYTITVSDVTQFSFCTAHEGTLYVFKVAAVTSTGVSSESELSDPIETKAEPWGVKIYKSLQPIPNSNPPTYQLPTHCVMQKGDIVKVHVGANRQDKTRKGVHTTCSCHTRTAGVTHKVLMVVGATGAGKTTLINGMANYILGVQWDDDFRFKLIAEPTSQDQSKSQTMCITAYTFYKESGSSLPYTLTVIDTPGFGDTGGLMRDRYIVSQIKELFSIAGAEGIDQLHGIGFVTQAPLARLTPTQQYVFDAILSVFGKDVADNIFLMITFADGMKPPVLDAVKAAGVPNKAFFKFNNSALFAIKSADDEFDRMFWKMGTKSFDEFFKQFSSVQARSLQLSREVIQEREILEVTIQGLQPQIQLGLSKIDELRQERQMLKDHEAEILTNQDFTYKVEVTKQRKIDLPSGQYTTNCLTCNYTCHDDCVYNDDDDKYKCSAMRSGRGTPNAACGICPNKCSWKMHKNNPYRFELYKENETRTSDELKTRYESAMSSKEQLECVIRDMKNELDTMNMAVLRKMEQVRRSVQRLQEIALRPNYLTEVEYIDLIIETEKREAKPRWLERVQALEGVRQQAEIVTELMKNPPQGQQQYVFSIEETAQEKSIWQMILHKLNLV